MVKVDLRKKQAGFRRISMFPEEALDVLYEACQYLLHFLSITHLLRQGYLYSLKCVFYMVFCLEIAFTHPVYLW